MINIDFENNIIENFTVVLSTRSMEHKGQIANINQSEFTHNGNLNSAQEISFPVYKVMDEHTEMLWNDIVDLKLVWVKELDTYFEIKVSVNESNKSIKNVTGTSLCEAELSQTLIRNLEVNSEDDISRDNYVPTVFFNEGNPDASLLHRVLSKMPHYSIKHVDESLKKLQRTFSVDGTSIYDFFAGECSEQFNCLFQFDTRDRSMSVYDLFTVCNDCGNRGEFNDICPKCGSKNLNYFGENTTIFVSVENLTDSITYETDVDSIKNCFKLEAGDEYMTATIAACNPNGSSYLYYFSDEQKKDMPSELVQKLESYDDLVTSYSDTYMEITEEIYDCINQILYYRSEMMPTVEVAETNASTEAAKLTVANLSPIGLTSVNSYTSTATVNSALKNFAAVFVKTGYVKVEIDTGNFAYVGTDSGNHNYGNWTGRFKVTNYSNEEDVAYSGTLTIKVTDDYEYYLTQKVQKNISKSDNEDSVYDVLSINNLTKFKEALTYYCLNRLESFESAIQGAINVLIEEKQAGVDSEYYDKLYTPYYEKLKACQDEINKRDATVSGYEEKQKSLEKQRADIQNALNFESYLGSDLYKVFCCYRREDTYQNSNYISDGLDDSEIFKNALEFIETAKKEIVKSGEHQHSISANLYNLLVMDEFAPLRDSFELGNWIRCKVDDNVYRLRLVSYQISGNDLKSISTEFSDMTKTADSVNDMHSVIQSAKSMASSYSYVSSQASKGNEAQKTLKDYVNDGLNSALVNIKNNDTEEITFDNHGLLAKSHDDITDDYSPKQLRITHNILAFTEDNWKTVSLGLGEHDYIYYDDNGMLKHGTGYGLSSKFVQAGYINGSQIIGGEVYSQNYSLSEKTGTYLNLNNGEFSWAGGKIKYDGNNLILSGVDLTWSDIGDAPTIPSKTSQLENDSGYQNAEQVTKITTNTISTSYINGIDFNATGIFTSTGTSTSGIVCKTSLRAGHVEFFYDGIETGDIVGCTIHSIGLHGIGIGSENFIMFNNGTSIHYIYNPTGALADKLHTNRHIFNGTVMFNNSTYTPKAYIVPSYDNTDTNTYVYLYNTTYSGSNAIISSSGFYAYGDMGCSGTKYRVVDTEHYGKVGMSAFETTEPYFADIGSGIISDTGSTTIFIDPVFAETIDLNSEYQVFITSSSAQVYVKKDYESFTVYGEAGTTFDWMVCSKQKNYSAVRMEQVDIDESDKIENEEEIVC